MADRAGSLRAWLLHSTVLHSLYDNALTNAEQLFSFGTVNVMRDAFGRLFVVTDSDALINPGASPTYNTLGLVEGGGMLQPAITQPSAEFRNALRPGPS